MTTGRTTLKNWRAYVDGYDLSGYTRSFGPLACTYEEGIDDALTFEVKAVVPGNANVSMGTLTGIFDNTATSGLHAIMKSAGVSRDVMLPCGIQAAPVDNDPVFAGQFEQLGYVGGSELPIIASIPFGQTSIIANNLQYAKPWGVLLLAKVAKTAANTAIGLDQTAQSLLGGWMMYQVFAGNGTAALKVQHASTNLDGSFSDLLSSGVITCAAGVSGVVQLAKPTTVERYVRWQLALGTATSVTFALSFHRNNL